MLPKLSNLKPREIIRVLEKAGYYIHETGGSHVQLKHPSRPGRITVPYHERFDLPKHIVETQNGMTVLDLSVTNTNTYNPYVIMPIPANVKNAGPAGARSN